MSKQDFMQCVMQTIAGLPVKSMFQQHISDVKIVFLVRTQGVFEYLTEAKKVHISKAVEKVLGFPIDIDFTVDSPDAL